VAVEAYASPVADRPTRWQRAKRDWSGFEVRRDIVVAVLGGAIAAGVFALLGFPWDTILSVIVGVGSAAAAVVILRLVELWWAWFKAPMRMLTEDVVAIRQRLEAGGGELPVPVEPPNVRLGVLEYARRAQVWADRGSTYRKEVEAWAREVGAFLGEYGTEDEAERFLTAAGGWKAQLGVLRDIADERKTA
jgi:hypothetical protein